MVIDTNIFIEHLRAKQKSTTKLVQLLNDGNRLFISSVTVYELYSGAITPKKQIVFTI